MKIMFLSAANSIHTVRWVNTLADRGHEVHLVYNAGHDPKQNKIDKRVRLYALKHSGAKGYYLNAPELHHLTRRIAPDVINVHYASGYGTLARWGKIGSYLLSVWGSDVYEFPYQNKLNKWILSKNVKNAKMLASTSNCMAEQLCKVLGRELEIGITPFGVDMNRFRPEYHKKKEDCIVIGTVKALEPVYRIRDLIEAVSLLKQKELPQEIKVKIYGDGSLKEELKEQIKQLKMDDIVSLEGKIPNDSVPKALEEMDIFCAVSEKESFGVAVVEAMAMARPVVVTNAEGFREVVTSGENGFICEVRNPKAIAEALECLIIDEKKRDSFGKAGYERARAFYDWQKNVDTMEMLYQKLARL